MTDQHRPITFKRSSLGSLVLLRTLAPATVQRPAAAEPAVSPKAGPIKLFDGK